MSIRGRKNNSRYRKESRQKAVKERADYRATLSPMDQLKRLDARLGANTGAIKERIRLSALLESTKVENKPKKKNKTD